jgi:hypothetical protein
MSQEQWHSTLQLTPVRSQRQRARAIEIISNPKAWEIIKFK